MERNNHLSQGRGGKATGPLAASLRSQLEKVQKRPWKFTSAIRQTATDDS